ncbi:GNAT family N-acetyltransferase [Rhizobium sp. C4]|nr:GNAT family N-acetyltransferase [Rhizobium sp. C4]
MRRLSAPQPIRPEHDCDDFVCGEPALDDWLRYRALKNESRFSRTYVVLDGDIVVGYYSLSSGGVARALAPGKLRRNAPDTIPVAIIARLAIDQRHAGQGLGSDLLMDALRRCTLASKAIGIAAVMIHAKSDAARRFYLKQASFIEYPADSRILYLEIDTVLAALSAG